jgi:hypothetical protein
MVEASPNPLRGRGLSEPVIEYLLFVNDLFTILTFHITKSGHARHFPDDAF